MLRPETSNRTRLLVRTRANYAPRGLAPFVPFAGLFDATYGVAMLRTIAIARQPSDPYERVVIYTAHEHLCTALRSHPPRWVHQAIEAIDRPGSDAALTERCATTLATVAGARH